MINHARTLLMNVTGPRLASVAVTGDVYIPTFEPVVLSAELEQIRSVLFGSAPDYEGRVYRTAQYLGILHSTEYAGYVTALDPRLTYDSAELGIVDSGLYGAMVTGEGLTVTGTWSTAGSTGRAGTKWRITAVTATTLLVENMTDGLTTDYRMDETKYLIGSTLVFSVSTQPMIPGTTWRVHHTARITPDLGLVCANLKGMSTGVLQSVLGTTPRTEPFKTFANLFKTNGAMPYQLTGILLAYVYTLNGLRTDA